jgi:tetratricopeptide (TPR) repeat protein
LAQIGSFDETRQYGEEATRTAMERNYPLSIVFAYYAVGAADLIRGEFDGAIEALEHALSICEAAEIPVQRAPVISGLSAAYAFAGRFHDGLRLLESTSDRSWMTQERAEQVPLGKALGMVWDVETYLLAGRYSEAEALARQVLAVFGKSKHRGSEAWIKYLLGDILAHRDSSHVTQAEEHYREALLLSRELGMRPLQAHCHLGLAQIHSESGNRSLARTEIQAASDLYHAMRMFYWLDKANRTLPAVS